MRSALVVLLASLVVAPAASARLDASARLQMVWPANGTVTSPFGGWRGNHRHEGIDIGMLLTLRLRAVTEGVVRRTGYDGGYEGYGKIIVLDLPGPYSVLYAHLSNVAVQGGRARPQGRADRSGGLHGQLLGHAPALRGPAPRRPDRPDALPRLESAPQGRLAQLGEHQLDKLGVTGSSPVPPTSRREPKVLLIEGFWLFFGARGFRFRTLKTARFVVGLPHRLPHTKGTENVPMNHELADLTADLTRAPGAQLATIRDREAELGDHVPCRLRRIHAFVERARKASSVVIAFTFGSIRSRRMDERRAAGEPCTEDRPGLIVFRIRRERVKRSRSRHARATK